MAAAVVYGVAENVLKNLGSAALGEIASAWGFKVRLEQLKDSISTVKDVLLDAEEKLAHSLAVRNWLHSLANLVYDADDLFDEFATVAARKQLMDGNQVINEVCHFFSGSNQIAFAFGISREIKRIREQLDEIVKKGNDFGLVSRCYEEGRVVSRRRDDTYSYVDTEDTIGRDGDKQVILNLLLASGSTDDDDEHDDEVLPVIPIVGMGGMGKTALSQLIYNDPQVEEFFDLRLWVCVSEDFDIKGIAEKILKKETQKLGMEQLQVELRKELGDKKYLLVLDDVWNDNREKWLKLRALLKNGRKGSKILVTTRSRAVADIMGTFPPHDLQGLLEEETWKLFEKLAFIPGEAQQKPHLVELGKEIVKKCANVPLAVRTVASLLYGNEERKWSLFKDTSLANISEHDQNHIMDILKLSYHHLWSPLKNCFSYCALFPKDYKFDKETLIDLWMAEGFIIPTDKDSRSLKEIGEDYFYSLLQRGFFQDVEIGDCGGIESCKMHDLAQEVAGVNCKVVKLDEIQYHDNKIRHLSFAYPLTFQNNIPDGVLKLRYLRTILLPQQLHDGSTFSNLICQKLVSSLSCLRVLDLHQLGVKSLPSSIGKLVHLKYLNLSNNPLIELPNSITELQNLQTLNLERCGKLKSLPLKIRKLINLRSLNFRDCDELQEMPSGLGELTLLHKLSLFIVNPEKSPEFRKNPNNNAKLSDLNKLNNLRGELTIKIKKVLKNTKLEATEANLMSKHGLIDLRIEFERLDERGDEFDGIEDEREDDDKVVLEGLKPHCNLRKLFIKFYCSRECPSWVDSLYIALPNLVEIELWDWKYCQQVPAFSQLPLLKRLTLVDLSSVEYMETGYNVSMPTPLLFFPSLEYLVLFGMHNLKGWWRIGCDRRGESSKEAGQPCYLSSASFPKLLTLHIGKCPNLTSLPNCPNMLDLILEENSKNLSVDKMISTSSKLEKLWIDNVEDVISLPKQYFCQLHILCVCDRNLLGTGKLGQVFASLSSSLRVLQFFRCVKLRSISKGLEHLTALEVLSFTECRELDVSEAVEEDGDGMPWKAFKNTLRSLILEDLPKLVSLPSGLQHLASLRSLEISDNKNLKELGEWICCLSSLRSLELSDCSELSSLPQGIRKLTALNQLRISNCPKLTESCRRLNGSDWSKIQHIPFLYLKDDCI